MSQQPGCVYLVGAGCGGSDLITVRGFALLRSCDVLVYDDLIARELLDAVPAHAEKIYMGKRSGRHSAPQEEICALLTDRAREGKTVVRLKGGDPFVFGRGGEELLALRSAGIPCEAVPGISSAIAIPGLSGIPVTHRGTSQSVHIVTAHTADTQDGLPAYFDDLARLPGTLVFLMGLAQLPKIVRRLTAAGMPSGTPAAVISGGSSPHPATVRGTLEELEEKVRKAGVQSPAVIVVGAAAAMDLSSTVPRPLQGACIGLTGTSAVTEKLQTALQALGARVFLAERPVVEPLKLPLDLHTLCGGKPHWLVFTSANGVDLFFREASRQELDLRRLHACRFAVIGPATARELKTHGILADLCPERYTSEALGQLLLQTVRPEEDILLLRSRRGSTELFQALAARHTVQDIPLYDLRPDPLFAAGAYSQLDGADYLTFSSASGVELFFDNHGVIPERAVCVCIGEVTSRALSQRYPKPFLTAPEISADGIVRSICGHWETLHKI